MLVYESDFIAYVLSRNRFDDQQYGKIHADYFCEDIQLEWIMYAFLPSDTPMSFCIVLVEWANAKDG